MADGFAVCGAFFLWQTKAAGSGGRAMALLFLLFEKFFIELF
jgi:hypothetical protein